VELTNTASVKRLTFRVVPDDTTRGAVLKRGEADIVYSVRGALGEEIARTPGLKLAAIVLPANQWLVFVDQWKPGSPWADRRVRLAAKPGDRPEGDQPGRGAGPLEANGQHDSPGLHPAPVRHPRARARIVAFREGRHTDQAAERGSWAESPRAQEIRAWGLFMGEAPSRGWGAARAAPGASYAPGEPAWRGGGPPRRPARRGASQSDQSAEGRLAPGVSERRSAGVRRAGARSSPGW